MANDVKNVLNSWCAKEKYPPPQYEYTNMFTMKANGARSNQPTSFKCQLTITARGRPSTDGTYISYIGIGEARARKLASTEAARDIVIQLLQANLLPRHLLKNVPNADDLLNGEVDPNNTDELTIEQKISQAVVEVHKPSVLGTNPSQPLQTVHNLKMSYANWNAKETQIGQEVKQGAWLEQQTSVDSGIGQTQFESHPVVYDNKKRKRSDDAVYAPIDLPCGSEVFYGRKKQKVDNLDSSLDDVIVLDDEEDTLKTDGGVDDDLVVVKEVTKTKVVDRHSRELQVISEQIQAHYERNRQDDAIFDTKMEVRTKLLDLFRIAFNDASVQLFAVGSSVNGMGAYNSDMDLCLVVPDAYVGTRTNKNYALDVLKYAQKALRGYKGRKGLARHVQLIPAVVPILKVDLNPPYEHIELDINCNNTPGVYNSHLLHYYAQVDPRFPSLCLMIKHWAIVSDINDAMMGTFNSYSLILLALHYLQCGVSPPVLPVLSKVFPEKFDGSAPLNRLSLFQPLGHVPGMRQRNAQSLGELLAGFFAYYDREFSFKTTAISIKEGRAFPRSSLAKDTEKYEIYIEEPFDGNNTARCIQKQGRMAHIRDEFRKAAECFLKSPSLESLGISV